MHPLARRLTALLPDTDQHEVVRLGARLADRYATPPRHYHTDRHALFVHGTAMTLVTPDMPAAQRQAVGLAALWHDAVYVAGADDNEAASAANLVAELAGHVDPDALVLAARLVLGTDHHRAEPGDQPAAVLYDADLASLGKHRDAYWADNADIRAEYDFVSDADWKVGRSAFIVGMLDRPYIFATSVGIRRWEAQARSNLQAELEWLGHGTTLPPAAAD